MQGGPMFDPWSGNYILYAATKSLHAVTKDPACQLKDPAWKKKILNVADED